MGSMRKKIKSKYMMATKAKHNKKDFSSSVPDLCVVHYETPKNYIGSWFTGIGAFDVFFLKETTRELTEKEIKYYSKRHVMLNSNYLGKLKEKELRNES